jgi:hypothetical protein
MKHVRPLPGTPDVACRNADTKGERTPLSLFGEGRRVLQHGRREITHICTWVFYPGSGRDDRVITYVMHV